MYRYNYVGMYEFLIWHIHCHNSCHTLLTDKAAVQTFLSCCHKRHLALSGGVRLLTVPRRVAVCGTRHLVVVVVVTRRRVLGLLSLPEQNGGRGVSVEAVLTLHRSALLSLHELLVS